MSLTLLLAAALTFAIGVAHSYLGERCILVRLFRRTDLPHLFGSDLFTRRTLRFAWHLTTVAWWGCGFLLLVAARAAAPLARPVFGAVLAGTFLASTLVTLIGSRGRHLGWIVFLAIAALSWFGLR